MTQAALLSTHKLTIGYSERRKSPVVVCENISESLVPGEMVCLIGPNGAGKSTLLRTLAGMQSPLFGSVKLLRDDVHSLPTQELARRLSIVLTDRIDVGLLSGYELVSLGRHPYTDWTGALSDRDHAVVHWAIESVDASTLASRPVQELSDGERQKIMIARALAQEPALMILDEPTAYLDLPRRVEMMQLLRELARQTGRTVLLSTHDLDLALRSADRIWLMPSNGPMCTGGPEDLVLSGAFERAFQSEGVQFDVQTGSFQVQQTLTNTVRLSGEGVAVLWTQRALKRAGFEVMDTESAVQTMPHVHVVQDNAYELRHNGEIARYANLYELVQNLRTQTGND